MYVSKGTALYAWLIINIATRTTWHAFSSEAIAQAWIDNAQDGSRFAISKIEIRNA